MPLLSGGKIRGIVFDLDGTLYVCELFAARIQEAATAYVTGLRGITLEEAGLLMSTTRLKLVEERGTAQTISAVCTALGGCVQEMHRFFQNTLQPEAYLHRDERVIRLLEGLAEHFLLYIYTNNNRVLTTRITAHLGIDHVVQNIFAIDDTWCAKPDERIAGGILGQIGCAPDEVLFVGDRYDIDLRVPEQLGCPVYLSQSVEQLLRLEELLPSATPSADM